MAMDMKQKQQGQQQQAALNASNRNVFAEKKLSPKELERKLGQQYSQILKDTKQDSPIYRDCVEVIHTALDMMEYYNRVALNMKGLKTGIKKVTAFQGSLS